MDCDEYELPKGQMLHPGDHQIPDDSHTTADAAGDRTQEKMSNSLQDELTALGCQYRLFASDQTNGHHKGTTQKGKNISQNK